MLHARLRAAAGNRGGIPTEGLLAHWTMDAITGSTLLDETGSHDGIISGATQVTGLIGQALSFSGTDQYVETDSIILPGLSAVSVSAFVKPDFASLSSNRHVFRQRGGIGNELMHVRVQGSSNTILGVISIGASGFTLETAQTFSNYTDAEGWIHIILQYDGAAASLYINNVLEDNVAATGVIPSSTEPLYLSRNGVFGQNWKGLIDQFRIYNRALDSSERANLYAEGL